MSNKSTYLEGRNKIFNSFLNEKTLANGIHNHQFNLVSANLFKFLPEIKFNQHEIIFKEILLHNRLSHFEQLYNETFDYVTCENFSAEYFKMLKEKPCILSTLHFGSYRLFNTFLIKNRIPYTIVIPKDILEREGETLRKIYANGNLRDDSKFIEVESPALGLKILRELKNGRSIFIYFDGYRGVGDKSKNISRNKSEDKIDFLNQSIYSKKGVTYLAKAAKVPLVIAVAYRKRLEDIRLHFFDPIIPENNLNSDNFAYDTTQLIYNMFTTLLKQYPGQWETWLYLHKQIDSTNLNSVSDSKQIIRREICDDERFSFNPIGYGLFKIKEDTFIFNKHSYSTYPIDSIVYNLLLKSSDSYIKKNQLSDIFFNQLYTNNALVPFNLPE